MGTKKKNRALGTMNIMFDVHYYVTLLGMALRAHSHHPLHVLERISSDTNHVLSAIQPAAAQKT